MFRKKTKRLLGIISLIFQFTASGLLGDDEFCNIQSQAAAAFVPAPGSIAPEKRFEQMRQILLINVCIPVSDLAEHLIIFLPDSDRDHRALL